MRHHINLQDKNECLYFIADYHSLTTVRDPDILRQNILEIALDYLALGIDPDKAAFFRQSSVPQHTELCWILNCITSMGLIERSHAWKDAKSSNRKDPTVGLFDYPVLMAADILMYKPDKVPVGKDQKQHIEITRDIALKFNSTFGETFKIPEEMIDNLTAVIPGTDGEKMSKSYGNVIEIFADETILKKQVMSIQTDSTPLEEPKNPKTCTVFKIYSLLAEKNEIEDLKNKYLKGGFGYGDAKKLLLTKILETFSPFRKKRIELERNLSYVNDVLNEGAKKARKIAEETLKEVREKVGLE